MVRKRSRDADPREPQPEERPPILVRCVFRIPADEAEHVLPQLPIAPGCGGANIRKRRTHVEVEALLEMRSVLEIVEHGVPVLLTEHVPVTPIPKRELIADAAAWFRHVRRLG